MDLTINHANFPYSNVQDPNVQVCNIHNKIVMDILVSAKYSVLPNKYLDNMETLCQKSVWDEPMNQEQDDSDREGYNSDQHQALCYKMSLLKN